MADCTSHQWTFLGTPRDISRCFCGDKTGYFIQETWEYFHPWLWHPKTGILSQTMVFFFFFLLHEQRIVIKMSAESNLKLNHKEMYDWICVFFFAETHLSNIYPGDKVGCAMFFSKRRSKTMIVSLQLLPCLSRYFQYHCPHTHTVDMLKPALSLPSTTCSANHCELHVSVMSTFFFFFFYAAVSHVLWADILATEITAIAPGACYIHSGGTAAVETPAPSRLNVVPGCVITECVMGMQGHLDLQSQVLALQLTASSIIDRGKPIRTICSPQRSARAA